MEGDDDQGMSSLLFAGRGLVEWRALMAVMGVDYGDAV